ncbi:MAG: hypothetical protein HOQ17_05920 [Gemmatimonadaceae bacterium]|nr:hypothetical protein [Gemmatimonadaceae bacterium]NUS32580.1 hypothetical protein [Gemmatimonadaceae bacterium]
MRRILGALSLAAVAACRYQPTPVPLQGEAQSIAALRGKWSGEYWGTTSERRGSLSFTISATADSAFGDVIMLTPQGQQLRPVDAGDRHRLHTASAQALRIDFVRIGAGMVSGTLEPYIAPDCECQVSTTFTGNVLGDTIRGTFITNRRQGGNRDGMWMMTRRAR